MSGYTEIALLQYEIKKLRAERSALRAELREICATIDDPACDLVLTAVECIKKLKAENESLKLDAERYRGLKNNNSPTGIYSNTDFDGSYYYTDQMKQSTPQWRKEKSNV